MGSDIHVFSRRFREREGLYLNLGSPSLCSGIVTSWHYCYGMTGMGQCLLNDSNSTSYHSATFMMYRPGKNNSSEYVVIPESVKSVTVKCRDTDKITCGKEILNRSEWFAIHENDIIAVFLPEQTLQFQLISRRSKGEGGNAGVFQYTMNAEYEKDLSIINRANLTSRMLLQLHLLAELEPANNQSSPINEPNNNTTFFLKTILPSVAGLVLITIVIIGIVLTWKRQKQRAQVTEQSQNCTSIGAVTNGDNRECMYSAPIDTRTTTAFTIMANVAYSHSSHMQNLNNRDTYEYVI